MTGQQLPPFTRTRLRDLEECPRRYWLRNIAGIPWPAAALPAAVEAAIDLGLRFHQLMRRHFLGIEPPEVPAPQVLPWWNAWLAHPLVLPADLHRPEVTLSVPFAGARLLTRFDLLALDSRRAVIVDWKTEQQPRTRQQLAADVQTQLYPFVLAEASAAVTPDGQPLAPEQVEMVFWYAHAPDRPVRFRYSAQSHRENQQRFRQLVQRAQSLRPGREPPLIDQTHVCARCPFRTYCAVSVPPDHAIELEEDDETPQPDVSAEPIR